MFEVRDVTLIIGGGFGGLDRLLQALSGEGATARDIITGDLEQLAKGGFHTNRGAKPPKIPLAQFLAKEGKSIGKGAAGGGLKGGLAGAGLGALAAALMATEGDDRDERMELADKVFHGGKRR